MFLNPPLTETAISNGGRLGGTLEQHGYRGLCAHSLWTIDEPWGWGTGDADQLMNQLRRFGSVTVLDGHIYQIVQKVDGNMTFRTARSTAYPQPTAGRGSGPAPLKVAADQLPKMLGITGISVVKHPRSLALSDTTIA